MITISILIYNQFILSFCSSYNFKNWNLKRQKSERKSFNTHLTSCISVRILFVSAVAFECSLNQRPLPTIGINYWKDWCWHLLCFIDFLETLIYIQICLKHIYIYIGSSDIGSFVPLVPTVFMCIHAYVFVCVWCGWFIILGLACVIILGLSYSA